MTVAVGLPGLNVIDFAGYREGRRVSAVRAQAIQAVCRHCGAALGEGESDDDCSSAGLTAGVVAPPLPRRKFRAE